jgi:hypothetical protein
MYTLKEVISAGKYVKPQNPALLDKPIVRWTAYRKKELIDAVVKGAVDRAAALAYHGVSEEEFSQWQADYARSGTSGLRALNVPVNRQRRRGRTIRR